MPTPPPDDESALLEANAAFYHAFATRDAGAMEAIWAKAAPICCIHPGWPPLVGRDAVLEGWRRILANPAQPALQMMAPKVTLWGDVAMVICFEKVEDQYLVASNIFVREGRGWKLSHHQAGPVATPPQGGASNDDPEPDEDDDDDIDEDDDDDLTPPSGTIH
ncbi:MAG TPA: nuclear transport factor 2 family protein [Ferrovibrio sp.]|jgi:hypothetical protein|uniref:nuclear transport factor 2 family protein n=1 Tax=Ferrovibrio sp. TaxID=1917215 RepID=UPI002B4ABD3C|nr:nuclear transport factor 2 family protein [Ferrovibrio sp.]HLT76720.1 nuclear transport factor 2 family protein [Ferrovibrio sp.]